MATTHHAHFDGPSHEGEYVVHVEGITHPARIPTEVIDRIAALLPGWTVSNRGTRIEIYANEGPERCDELVLGALAAVLGPNG